VLAGPSIGIVAVCLLANMTSGAARFRMVLATQR
jgi:hypothetical protein